MALAVAISTSFFGHSIIPLVGPSEFLDFSLKIKFKILGIFLYQPVLGSPDNTLTKFYFHPNAVS